MAKYEPSHLKSMNTRIVFQEFRSRSGESLFAKEIARTSGISVPTVMKIVDFLMEKELIKEEECNKTRVGRKPNMLTLNKDKYFSVGIIYEGDYMTLGMVDLAGNIKNFIQVRCGQHFENSLYTNIDKLLRMSGKPVEDLIGIGIGLPCIFDQEKREITAPLIGITQERYFGDEIDRIAQKYDAGVVVDNDLNIEAFGEYAAMDADSRDDLIYISLGTGLGAGVVIDGKVRRGKHNFCGEIGYLMFEYTEGQKETGWLEEKINIKALEERFGITELSCEETKKKEAVEYVSGYLAMLVNNLIFCYDVSRIVLDGYVVDLLGDELVEETQRKLERICYRPLSLQRRKAVSAGICGGALLAANVWLEEIFGE